MTRRFKTLGLAMVAMLVMSAVIASAAGAQFTANQYNTKVTATSALGNDVFTVDGGGIECVGHFSSELTGDSNTLAVIPTYTSCKAFGFASATVSNGGCSYVFHDVGNNASGRMSIECAAGKSFVVTAGNCALHIGTQTPSLGTVSFTNTHPNFEVKANVAGITANVTTDGFLCPINGAGHKKATYVQGSSVTMTPVGGGSTVSVD